MQAFVKSLPADFKGSVFVVLHIPPYTTSVLAAILTKAGPLKAVQPRDGEPIAPGRIYVAANDHHLLIEGGKVVMKKGPKENRFRPSIDALFRSAAYNYGPRVIGVVLSGVLDDGTSGLWSVKRMGGIAVIQDPDDADFPQMPLNVLEYVEVDHCLPVAAMGVLLQQLTSETALKKPRLSARETKLLKMEVVISARDNAFEMGILEMGELTPFTCPECHGCLVRLHEGQLLRFRCHTGHAYTASTLLASVSESVEEMLWQGMRGMEEVAILLRSIQGHFKGVGQPKAAALFGDKAEIAAHRARLIHDTVFQHEQYSEDLRLDKAMSKAKKVKAEGG